MKIISPRVHGILDYFVGVILMGSPWLFGFAAGGAETWIPVILGLVFIIYSLFTDYPLGVSPLISMRAHLSMDILGGIFLAVSPWLFRFSDAVFIPHLVFGIISIAAGVMTNPASESSHEQRHRHAH